jgi:hypothetical protein
MTRLIPMDTIRTAGTVLQFLSESSTLYLIENLASSSDHLVMLDKSIDLPNLTDAIYKLDCSELIELVDYQWLSPKLVLLTYGPGTQIKCGLIESKYSDDRLTISCV